MRYFLFSFFFFFCGSSLIAQSPDFDTGLIFNLTLRKRITPRWDFQLSQNIWTRYNASQFERYMPIVQIGYMAIPRYLKVSVGYSYIHQYNRNKQLTQRHRGFIGATAYLPTPKIGGWFKTSFESTYSHPAKSNPRNKLRHKLQLHYADKPNWKIRPYLSAESFLITNGTSGGELERIWYELGVEWRILQNQILDFRLRTEQPLAKSYSIKAVTSFFGIFYKILL